MKVLVAWMALFLMGAAAPAAGGAPASAPAKKGPGRVLVMPAERVPGVVQAPRVAMVYERAGGGWEAAAPAKSFLREIEASIGREAF